jgi:hypothetical protein
MLITYGTYLFLESGNLVGHVLDKRLGCLGQVHAILLVLTAKVGTQVVPDNRYHTALYFAATIDSFDTVLLFAKYQYV